MVDLCALPVELGFLIDFVGNRRDQYRSASWLTVPFENNVWNCYSYVIDFRVHLEDGSLLTDKNNRTLLTIFKSWLCVQSHFDATGGKLLNEFSIRQRIQFTSRLIDYFLINAERFQLSKHGLENVTENDLISLLSQISQSSSIFLGMYRWKERLSKYLQTQGNNLSDLVFARALKNCPAISENIPPIEECMLSLTSSEIIRARAWIWSEGYYVTTVGDFRFSPNTVKLAEIVYVDTLGGKWKKPTPPELFLSPITRYTREYARVPVKSSVEGPMSEKTFENYLSVMRRMGLLTRLDLPVPKAALRALATTKLQEFLVLKGLDRYRNLPQELVFLSLRRSIEFSLDFGKDLISSYLNLVRASEAAGTSCRAFCNDIDIRPFLTQNLIDLGVRCWTVLDLEKQQVASREQTHPNFGIVRTNAGLWELLRVLYGSVQVCVGSVMARRQSELIELVVGKCLDRTRTRLIFRNRKSGIAGMRDKEARPIPAIAVKLIGLLEQLQSELIAIGCLSSYTNLFAFPNFGSNTLVSLSPSQFNDNLDCFCDYFETQRNEKGQRYYIRQHQLRRFIAMLFFWGKSFGGLNTLRWYMAHTDVKHLYHYITESTPGEVLRSIKAIYATEQIKAHAEGTDRLADLLQSQYGTRNFTVLDDDELTEYIEELMYDKRIVVEPEFIKTPEGIDYRILIVVMPKNETK